ncbi:MAG: zf-TFIIB domain-containing protein [Armatimonadetes bacterium]|nr:zf-TFIIB domain-containing protein [Armatimonadota bacterium]
MSDTTLTCPRCQVALREHALGPVVVDGCDACGGLWFDTDELTKLARGGQEVVVAAEGVFAPPEPVADLMPAKGLCPRCQVPLYAFEFAHTPGVTLDACAECRGVWIDDGELESIGRRLAPKQQAPGPAAPRRSVRQRARQAAAFLHRVPCGKCGEENPESAHVCWACGATMTQHTSGRLCPRCDSGLDHIEADELQIVPPPALDHCPSCGGIWIQRENLSPLINVDLKVLKRWGDVLAAKVHGGTETRAADIICPVCQVVLDEHPYARDDSVRVDQCQCCLGLWLDSGELVLIKRVSVDQDVWSRTDGP